MNLDHDQLQKYMLVHQYWRVDDNVFIQNLIAGLKDFHDFVIEIKQLVDKDFE